MNKDNATKTGKNNNAIEGYVPQFTPSIPQQAMLSIQILSKIPREFQYVKRNVFMKEVNSQNLWTFELGTQEGIKVPILNIVRFQQRDRQDSAVNINKDTFYRTLLASAQCLMGTEKYPGSGISFN